jgi:hypothetical protein
MDATTGFSVETELSVADLRQFFMGSLLRRFRWTLLIAVPILIVATAINITAGQWNWNSIDLMGPIALLLLACLLLSPYFSAAQYLQKNPNVAAIQRYTFSSNGVDISAARFSGHVSWIAILRARETKTQFQLYSQTVLAYIIPKRYLTDSQQATLRDFIGTYVQTAKRAT